MRVYIILQGLFFPVRDKFRIEGWVNKGTLTGLYSMIRSFLFMYLNYIGPFAGIAKKRMDSSVIRQSYGLCGLSSGFELNDDQSYNKRIPENTYSELKLFSNVFKSHMSIHQNIHRLSVNVIHFNDINLFNPVREGPVLLSVIRL
jgi:hypothetical protein